MATHLQKKNQSLPRLTLVYRPPSILLEETLSHSQQRFNLFYNFNLL